ncbi:alkaline phosphatase [Ferrimonas pelagia]|uniref:Alkaline phosphatase n=2 Tax=Ferrimonas pelagia TaxID=1177826 RepID=A0ABP9ENC5_9GAMM
MIGDGMGPAYVTAHRYAQAGTPGQPVETTIFDELLVGSARTYPATGSFITDSAASATAMATGVKTRKGVIGMDAQHQPVRSILEQAKLAGKATGIVATSAVTHATPAGFVANAKRRSYQDLIAEQYVHKRIAERSMLDLMLGGGQQFFPRTEGGLADQLRDNGFEQAWDLDGIRSLSRLPAMGLIASDGLPFAINTDQPHRLRVMTDKALELLSTEQNGFFLMIEGSQIDWCGHSNDIRCALGEMEDFAQALKAAKAFVDANPDTLLIATADHDTGGLTLARQGTRGGWQPAIALGTHRTSHYITEALQAEPQRKAQAIWAEHADWALNSAEIARIDELRDQETNELRKAIADIVSARSGTGWTTGGHSAVDVPVMAYGAQAERFAGHLNNTDFAPIIFEMLNAD